VSAVIESVKEVWRGVIYGPPGLQRMCTHPMEAHSPSWEEAPSVYTPRSCKICGGQCE